MRYMEKRSLLFLFLLLGLLLTACGDNQTSEADNEGNSEDGGGNEETHELTFALDQQPKDTWVRATEEFATLVEEKTGGSITISVHDSGTLGSQRELLEGILNGTVDGTVTLEPLSYWVEEVNLFGIPYLFEDQEHLDEFMASEHGEELNQKMLDEGFRPLVYFDRPPRHLTSNIEVNSLEDAQGLKIRVPETATAPPAFEAMGMAPTAMAFSELYNALDTGVIDAQENPIPTIVTNNLHEVQDYLAYTNHQFQPAYFVISDEVYQSFSDEQKQAIDEAAEEMKEYEKQILAEDIESMEQEMEDAGITFTEPNVEEFSSAAQEAYSGYDQLMQDWIERIQGLRE